MASRVSFRRLCEEPQATRQPISAGDEITFWWIASATPRNDAVRDMENVQ